MLTLQRTYILRPENITDICRWRFPVHFWMKRFSFLFKLNEIMYPQK